MNDWQKIEEAVAAAAEMPAAEFGLWLADFCREDPELKSEIESLLAFQASSENFLEKAVGEYAAQILPEAHDDFAGKIFGNYKIVREIGRGGMGAVFLAERIDGEFSQQAALKIVRQTFVEKELLQHFKRERQILANLNHPNIAKLLDGGVSAHGEPFLVMEYIEGETLLKFARKRALDIKSRLKIFLKICRAVTFAHRNLIVHRDIKPSNILVTEAGEPKLLDFGLAKVLDSDDYAPAGGSDHLTRTAFRALTPAYASPEQIRGETVTTASDIYSLGKILAELTGNSAGLQITNYKLQKEDGRRKTGDGRRKTEDEKPKTEIQNPKSKIQNPNSDLQAILQTAMREEPERRYKSVESFAEDIENFLDGKPVKARPNTFRYRAAKFIRRNKIAVAAAVLIFLTLLGGVIATLRQTYEAQKEKEKAKMVNAFLSEMLNYTDPNTAVNKGAGEAITVKDVLDKAARQLEDESFAAQPEVKAELDSIIGFSYTTQGFYEQAEKHLRAALAQQLKIYGAESTEVIRGKLLLAEVLGQRAQLAECERIFREVLPVARAEFQKGSLEAVYLADALHNFAVTRRALGNSKEAEILLREGLTLAPFISEKGRSILTLCRGTLALTLFDQGKIDEAVEIQSQYVAELRQTSSANTADFGYALTGLGSFLSEKENFAEAAAALSEAEGIYRKLIGESHLWLGDNLRIQANLLYKQDRLREAQNKINETLRIYRANTGTQYINFPTALMIQGLILDKTGKPAEAEKLLREAVRIREENLPKEHFLTALARSALGENLTTQKRFPEAETLLTESYESLKNSQGEQNPRTLLAKTRLEKLFEAKSEK